MIDIATVTPSQFAARWIVDGKPRDVTLLDVREEHELRIASLPFATWIPMGKIPSRLEQLDRSETIVVMCHGGHRSMRIAQYLNSQGFEHVMNLTGGIDAWSVEVDAAVPRY